MIHISKTTLLCLSVIALALPSSRAAVAQAMTADKMPSGQAAAATKIVAENEKLQVTDNLVPPGAVSPISGQLGLVAYYVRGGTTERTFADGSKEVSERKTGETVLVTEKRPYSLKNTGKTTIHVITIRLK